MDRPITGVDHDSKPLAIGDEVSIPCVVKSMDEHGMVTVAIDSSDGVHHYAATAHCHCCYKK